MRNLPAFVDCIVQHRCSVAFLIPSHLDALMPLLEGAQANSQRGWLSSWLSGSFGSGGAAGGGGRGRGGSVGGGGGGAQPTKAACLRHIVLCGEALSVGTVRNFHARLGRTPC